MTTAAAAAAILVLILLLQLLGLILLQLLVLILLLQILVLILSVQVTYESGRCTGFGADDCATFAQSGSPGRVLSLNKNRMPAGSISYNDVPGIEFDSCQADR